MIGKPWINETFEQATEKLLEEFPKLEVQMQLKDLIETPEMRNHLRKHFRSFLHYLEEAEPVSLR